MTERSYMSIPRALPCACLLDNLKETPLFSNWVMLIVAGLFMLGALLVFVTAWKRGILNLKDMESIKYKVLEETSDLPVTTPPKGAGVKK